MFWQFLSCIDYFKVNVLILLLLFISCFTLFQIFQETAEEKLIVNDLKSVYHYVKSAEV